MTDGEPTRSHEAALAQYAMTGSIGATHHVGAGARLEDVIARCHRVDPGFVARAAVYARRRGHLKAAPALLCAWLSAHARRYAPAVFDAVVDGGRMLRYFVDAVRSGVTWRTSLGTLPRRLVTGWLDARPDDAVFRATVGDRPSLADVIRLAHPRPKTASRSALYAWAVGRPYDCAALPPLVQEYLAFRARGGRGPVPDVPFPLITSLPLDTEAWCHVARHAAWQALRMNLNTFARHGVFDVPGMTRLVADRLRDPEEIRRAGALPYQLLRAADYARFHVRRFVPPRHPWWQWQRPALLTEALQAAMEVAIGHVPTLPCKVYVCLDRPSRAWRGGVGEDANQVDDRGRSDTMALLSTALLRVNRDAALVETGPWGRKVHGGDWYAPTLANWLRVACPTNSCGREALAELNHSRAKGGLVVLISDGDAWSPWREGGPEGLMAQWEAFRARNPEARLACVHLAPDPMVEHPARDDILNVAGFSDAVFDLLALFASGGARGAGLVESIERTPLDGL